MGIFEGGGIQAWPIDGVPCDACGLRLRGIYVHRLTADVTRRRVAEFVLCETCVNHIVSEVRRTW